MKKMIIRLAVGLLSLGVVSAAESPGAKGAGAISPCVVLTGADSRVSKRGYHRVTSMKEWSEIWRKHKGPKSDAFPSNVAPPLVDFERFMVIAIFQGRSWNSAGLEAVSISEHQDRIAFRFDDMSYQTSGPDGGGKPVTVYGFFVLPRSTKAVILEEDVQGLIGEPPVWKQRMAFPKL